MRINQHQMIIKKLLNYKFTILLCIFSSLAYSATWQELASQPTNNTQAKNIDSMTSISSLNLNQYIAVTSDEVVSQTALVSESPNLTFTEYQMPKDLTDSLVPKGDIWASLAERRRSLKDKRKLNLSEQDEFSCNIKICLSTLSPPTQCDSYLTYYYNHDAATRIKLLNQCPNAIASQGTVSPRIPAALASEIEFCMLPELTWQQKAKDFLINAGSAIATDFSTHYKNTIEIYHATNYTLLEADNSKYTSRFIANGIFMGEFTGFGKIYEHLAEQKLSINSNTGLVEFVEKNDGNELSLFLTEDQKEVVIFLESQGVVRKPHELFIFEKVSDDCDSDICTYFETDEWAWAGFVGDKGLHEGYQQRLPSISYPGEFHMSVEEFDGEPAIYVHYDAFSSMEGVTSTGLHMVVEAGPSLVRDHIVKDEHEDF